MKPGKACDIVTLQVMPEFQVVHGDRLMGLNVVGASNIPHGDECAWCLNLRDRIASRTGVRPA